MKKFGGKGIYGGVAIGKISLLNKDSAEVKRVHVTDVEIEKARFEQAKALTARQLGELYHKALKEVGEADAAIFEIHQMMLDDKKYNDSISRIIEDESVNAEYAVAVTADNLAEMFSAMGDAYMKARAEDISDISNRLLHNLAGSGSMEAGYPETQFCGNDFPEAAFSGANFCEKRIICASDLTPGETVMLDRSRVMAVITAHGSTNSHAAILARSMNIPAVMGVGDEFLNEIRDGDDVIVDGGTGEILLEPDNETRARYLKKQRVDEEKEHLLQKLKGKENVTLDGRKINVYANIGSVDDIDQVLANDAGGIGLFRSEFLYLESSGYPTEEQQFTVYRKVLEGMEGKKIIIRTLDIGADKKVDYFNLREEKNPALGYRAIRICLTRPDILRRSFVRYTGHPFSEISALCFR